MPICVCCMPICVCCVLRAYMCVLCVACLYVPVRLHDEVLSTCMSVYVVCCMPVNIYAHTCVCVCVCVFTPFLCVCVCVSLHVVQSGMNQYFALNLLPHVVRDSEACRHCFQCANAASTLRQRCFQCVNAASTLRDKQSTATSRCVNAA